jgi:hypothetical protein
MQISPVPGFAWSNPAAAVQQAATDQRTNSASTAGSVGANKPSNADPSIGDVERTSETMDRDANGQYNGSAMQREPASEDGEANQEQTRQEPQSLLELPALEQQGELDLLG